jgi:hypothetical protein
MHPELVDGSRQDAVRAPIEEEVGLADGEGAHDQRARRSTAASASS